MDPFTKSDEAILMTADMKAQGDGGLVIFDFPAKKITPLGISPVKNLKHPGLCKLRKNIYLVAGGYTANDSKVSKSAYIVDIKSGLVVNLPDMNSARFQFECLFFDNKVYVISGRNTVKNFLYISQCEYYDFVIQKWCKMTDHDDKIKGIQRIFVEGNKIVCIFFKTELSSYDLQTNTWTFQKRFTYDIDAYYVTNSNESLVVNNYYNSICKYDYFKDTILFDYYIDDFKGIHHFYLQEIDCLVFTDDSAKSSFVVLDCSNRNIKVYNEDDYDSIFQNYRFMYPTGNFSLKPAQLKDENIDVLDGHNVFIYGNWNYPFSLVLNLTEDDVTYKFHPVPERLHLKSEQGLTYLEDNKFIFAGGYDDDRSYTHTSDTYAFNPNDDQLAITDPLVQTVGNIMLKRLNMPKDSHVRKLHNEEDYYVFMVNENDEPEIYLPKTGKWSEVEPYGFTFLPNLLDVSTGIVVFFVKKNQGKDKKNVLIFKVYDMAAKNWVTCYEKPTTVNMYIYFCYKIDNFTYLVITDEGVNGIMISKMELVFESTILSDVKFTPLDRIDEEVKGNTINFIMDDNNLVLIYVEKAFQPKIINFDLEKLKVTENDRIKKIRDTIMAAFTYLRFTKFATFSIFSYFCSNRLTPNC